MPNDIAPWQMTRVTARTLSPSRACKEIEGSVSCPENVTLLQSTHVLKPSSVVALEVGERRERLQHPSGEAVDGASETYKAPGKGDQLQDLVLNEEKAQHSPTESPVQMGGYLQEKMGCVSVFVLQQTKLSERRRHVQSREIFPLSEHEPEDGARDTLGPEQRAYA